MEPFEIIESKKSFSDFSLEEKKIIKDLCSNEEEFIAMKTFLLQNFSTAHVKPSEKVKIHLDQVFTQTYSGKFTAPKKPISYSWLGYGSLGVAATAGIIIFLNIWPGGNLSSSNKMAKAEKTPIKTEEKVTLTSQELEKKPVEKMPEVVSVASEDYAGIDVPAMADAPMLARDEVVEVLQSEVAPKEIINGNADNTVSDAYFEESSYGTKNIRSKKEYRETDKKRKINNSKDDVLKGTSSQMLDQIFALY